VRIIFKIIKYRNDSGKILMTIETDDQMAADFCRFFGTINKFLDLFNYRVRSAKNFDLYQKTAPHKMALHKKNIAEQLERFGKMPGTRIERMRILKEIRISQGERVTLDQIDVELRHAKQYDSEGKMVIIKGLLESGKSLSDIVKTMNLPKSTVARMIKQLRPPEPPPEEASLASESVSRSEEA
jgi:DNA-binding MarR family transcriptional regulator